MKKNKVAYEAAMKQMDALMPDELRDPYKTSLTTCKDSGELYTYLFCLIFFFVKSKRGFYKF